jgi:hypothetical protein
VFAIKTSERPQRRGYRRIILSTLAVALNNPMNKSAPRRREFGYLDTRGVLKRIGRLMAIDLRPDQSALFQGDIN